MLRTALDQSPVADTAQGLVALGRDRIPDGRSGLRRSIRERYTDDDVCSGSFTACGGKT